MSAGFVICAWSTLACTRVVAGELASNFDRLFPAAARRLRIRKALKRAVASR